MLTNPRIVRRLTITSAKKYGRLDILVNNAGVLKEGQIFGNWLRAKPRHRGVARNVARNF